MIINPEPPLSFLKTIDRSGSPPSHDTSRLCCDNLILTHLPPRPPHLGLHLFRLVTAEAAAVAPIPDRVGRVVCDAKKLAPTICRRRLHAAAAAAAAACCMHARTHQATCSASVMRYRASSLGNGRGNPAVRSIALDEPRQALSM